MALPLSFLFTFIFATKTIDAISCLSPYLFTVSGDDFHLINLQHTLISLAISDENEYCFIRMGINYQKEIFELRSYTETDSNNLIKNRQIYFSTHLTIDQDQAIIWNIIEFICDYSNACDYTFAHDHLEWLLSTNYQNLALALRPLFPIEYEREEQCITDDEDRAQPCINGICHSQYSMRTKRMKSTCIKIPEMMPQILLITYITTEKNINEETSGEQLAKQDFHIEYRCQPNKCPNQWIRKQIRNIVRDHYNLSTFYTALNVTVHEDWREREVEQTSTIIPTQPTNDSIPQYLSIYTLSLLLLFVSSFSICIIE